MRHAEVLSATRDSRGATTPLMEGVRQVLGEVGAVTGTTSCRTLLAMHGEDPEFYSERCAQSVECGKCVCVLRED